MEKRIKTDGNEKSFTIYVRVIMLDIVSYLSHGYKNEVHAELFMKRSMIFFLEAII